MNKILKILSILVIGFVMFSCSTPTNDPTPYVPEPSSPETPEVQTYSITFVAEKCPEWDQPVADLLNSLPDYKNLKEDTEVELPTITYEITKKDSTVTYVLEKPEDESKIDYVVEYNIYYENNVTSVVVKNENIKIKFWCDK